MEFTKVNSGAFKLVMEDLRIQRKQRKRTGLDGNADECKGAVTTLRGPV